MFMLKQFPVLLGVFLLTLSNFASAMNKVNQLVVGSAYDVNTGALLYTETHEKPSLKEHIVTYREVSGDVFATKVIKYSYSLLIPDFYQMNKRNGEVIDVKTEANDLLLVNYQASNNSKVKSKQINISNRLIVDAGFDNFVRNYWNNLAKGDDLNVDFLAPTRQIIAPFKIEKTSCKEDEKNALCLTMSPDAWWLKLVVDPIYLAYDLKTRDLKRYVGRGNISEKDGDYATVDIHYQYEVSTN
jgi:hypothetical protein